MAKWEVKFDIRKGNSSLSKSVQVESESESMAVQLAETQARKSVSSMYRDEYVWSVSSVRRK